MRPARSRVNWYVSRSGLQSARATRGASCGCRETVTYMMRHCSGASGEAVVVGRLSAQDGEGIVFAGADYDVGAAALDLFARSLPCAALAPGPELPLFFFFSSRRRHTRFDCDWSSDVCSSD